MEELQKIKLVDEALNEEIIIIIIIKLGNQIYNAKSLYTTTMEISRD